MPSEHVSISPRAASQPLFPHDPPDAAPQAEAWRRALRVVGYMPPKELRAVRTTVVRNPLRKDKHASRRA
jgi:hypothetical protein